MKMALIFLTVLCAILLVVLLRLPQEGSTRRCAISTPTLTTYSTLDDWIRTEAVPFSIDSTESINAAVDKVIASLGDSVEYNRGGPPLPEPGANR
ncbi:MAG: hypothetical protein P8123_04055 [bacterium]